MLKKTRWLKAIPILAILLLFVMACGQPKPLEPVIIEKEVVKEVFIEVPCGDDHGAAATEEQAPGDGDVSGDADADAGTATEEKIKGTPPVSDDGAEVPKDTGK